jgi:hypothetical protein
MLFTPVIMTLYLGQVNFLVLLLVVLAYVSFKRGHLYVSGAVLALAAWIKVWPIALIAYFIWKRQGKVLLGAMSGVAIIGLLTLILAGSQQTLGFFTQRLPNMIVEGTYGRLDHLNQSIPGTFAKMFAPSSDYVVPLVDDPVLARLGSRIASLILVVATIMLCSMPVALKGPEQFSTEFMLVIIASMLITSRLWESNLVLLLPVYIFAARRVRQHKMAWEELLLLVLSFILIDLHRVIWNLLNPDRQALPWFLLTLPFAGTMLLWLSLGLQRVREAKAFWGQPSPPVFLAKEG